MRVEYTCAHCGTAFFRYPCQNPRFCSKRCSNLGQPRGRVRVPVEERFWSRVTKTDSCWLWTGTTTRGTSRSSYGVIGLGRRKDGTVLAHRFSYILHRGPIPDGMVICHACDVRLCVRPDHLWLGTRDDNQLDMGLKGRAARGEGHHNARLTEERVRIIRSIPHAPDWQLHAWAREWGISYTTVWEASRFKSWRHVAP